MDNPNLDRAIAELKATEEVEKVIAEKKATLRKEIFGIIENEGLVDGYKNKDATISYVERKTLKIADETKLIKDLVSQKIVNYYVKVPKHYELKPNFVKDVKEGVFKHELVEVEVSNGLSVRFNK